MEKSELVVVATPGPINPLKTTLGLSVIHSIPGAQCRGPQTSPIPHPPTFAYDPYNNTSVIATGRQRGRSREKFRSPDHVTSPNHAYLKKHWSPRLSILCLLGDQWRVCSPMDSLLYVIFDASHTVGH